MDTKTITEPSQAVRHQAVWLETLREFAASSKAFLVEHGITSLAYQAMLEISISDIPVTMNGLANRLGVRHNSAIAIVNRLQERGLVHRERTNRDRRVANLSITERGETVLDALAISHGQSLKRIAPKIYSAIV